MNYYQLEISQFKLLFFDLKNICPKIIVVYKETVLTKSSPNHYIHTHTHTHTHKHTYTQTHKHTHTHTHRYIYIYKLKITNYDLEP